MTKTKINSLSLKEKTMPKKAILIQPGKMGDLIATTPIAKHYSDLGYEIYWPVFDNYKHYFKAFPYIKAVTFNVKMNPGAYYNNQRIDRAAPNVFLDTGISFFKKLHEWTKSEPGDYKILDFCFTFPGHSNRDNNLLTKEFAKHKRNWIDLKYHLAGVPLKSRWKYEWKRDKKKEEELYNFIINFAKKKYGSEKYSIVHSYVGGNKLKEIDVENPINFSYIAGYEVYDWYKVLKNAQSIVCVDSCLTHFVEVVPTLADVEKHYLGSEEPHFHDYMRNILLNNWINHSNSDIYYDGLIL